MPRKKKPQTPKSVEPTKPKRTRWGPFRAPGDGHSNTDYQRNRQIDRYVVTEQDFSHQIWDRQDERFVGKVLDKPINMGYSRDEAGPYSDPVWSHKFRELHRLCQAMNDKNGPIDNVR